MKKISVIGSNINQLNWNNTINQIKNWSANKKSKYVCICNVHSVVTAYHDTDFAKTLNNADMATPDGAPVAWLMRQISGQDQDRINGPDLMWKYCQSIADTQEKIFLYGNTKETLEILIARLKDNFTGIKIAGAISPPFRQITDAEDKEIIDQINASGAGTVWISLGCPKQEKWMAEHRGKINAVMIGVGAAFDYHAGTLKRAPIWMQKSGLEWLYRLIKEPKRLWRRYLSTNSLYCVLALKQLLNRRH